ncbi:MAG: TIGR03067 domain-containing protein [Rhodospirillaceae bacterium]|nr:TIGR03067 domain-containing protein [Rhodospirillaceae bacterium]MDE0361333.1 TIGR03067 domain-containing protein [Rhodospirillaceae bacterium]
MAQMLYRCLRKFFVVLALSACLPATAQDGDAAQDFTPLQGSWTVRAAEQGGQPFDEIVGGVLTIDDDTFALRTAVGNEFSGALELDNSASPWHIDFRLTDGTHWTGIYTVGNGMFRLNYVDAGEGATRPEVFATTADTPGTVIVLGLESDTSP